MGSPLPKTSTSVDRGSVLVGREFGRYTLISKIGSGGMAEVYLASIRGPANVKKLCVLKRLHPHLEDEPTLVGMFLDEARLASRLSHPNVVQTYEVDTFQGLHFLTMEHLEGQSLEKILHRTRRLKESIPLAVGVRFLIDILAGLHYAHTLKDFDGTPLSIVHRDVSPGNIFVTYDGQCKLLDFGIAKARTQLVETQVGQVKGKFAYIAPEQALPEGVPDHRADLWSLGVVAWEMFAGRRLFKGRSEVITLHNTLNSAVLPLESQVDLPLELAQIVDRTLQRDPEQRYPSARQIKEDLQAFMADAGLSATREDIGAYLTGLFERERDEQRRVLCTYMEESSESPLLVEVTCAPLVPVESVQEAEDTLLSPSGEKSIQRRGWLLFVVVLGLSGIAGAILASTEKKRDEVESVFVSQSEKEEVVASMTSSDLSPAMKSFRMNKVQSSSIAPTNAGFRVEESAPMSTEQSSSSEGMTVMARRVQKGVRMRMNSKTLSMMNRTLGMELNEREQTGFLTLDTTPWSRVFLAGQEIGTTPIIGKELPVGDYTLILSNPEQGLRTTYRVNIEPNQTTTRRVGFR